MKLRNKKTGIVANVQGIAIHNMSFDLYDKDNKKLITDVQTIPSYYDSIAELNEEWEDYTPQEPLIKDEKIRKAVRAWAYVNSVKRVIYTHNKSKNLFIITDSDECYFIQFVGWIPELQDGCSYTIAELCGESES